MSKNEMIMLPRSVLEQALEAFEAWDARGRLRVMNALRAALEQPQGEQEPYLYYDPNNGDTWTQEAINDGCHPPDSLIALYTK